MFKNVDSFFTFRLSSRTFALKMKTHRLKGVFSYNKNLVTLERTQLGDDAIIKLTRMKEQLISHGGACNVDTS